MMTLSNADSREGPFSLEGGGAVFLWYLILLEVGGTSALVQKCMQAKTLFLCCAAELNPWDSSDSSYSFSDICVMIIPMRGCSFEQCGMGLCATSMVAISYRGCGLYESLP